MAMCEHGWHSATDCDACTLARVGPDAADRIAELEAERDALKSRLSRVEELARAPLIGGEGRYMQRLVSIRVELGVTPE